MLPDVYRSQAMLMIQQWTAKLATTPASDCKAVCKGNPTANACNALQLLAQHISEHMLSLQEEEIKACKGDKECIEEQSSTGELITIGIREMTEFVAYYADPKESCGMEEPIKASHLALAKSPKKVFACKVCKATLEFIHSTVVGGESKTSKKFIQSSLRSLFRSRV
ncbi:hypothetical protein OESDEN_02098 [Oesophagostomum dentatum]|uniref:Uncharacterized protein n=1 Tax=Oesophagostomum dentatum TaxID=61180 RepID=A0A0B1TQ08_OESDE|nr:hypothetical protein OESDEN_02098 [Oesophagostomum dentatum]